MPDNSLVLPTRRFEQPDDHLPFDGRLLKVSTSGEHLWGEEGVLIPDSMTAGHPDLVDDGSFWMNMDDLTNNEERMGRMRFHSNGESAFDEVAPYFTNLVDLNSLGAAPGPDKSLYVVYGDEGTGWEDPDKIYLSRIDSLGHPVHPDTAIHVLTAEYGDFGVLGYNATSDGGILFKWQAGTPEIGYHMFGAKFSSSLELEWYNEYENPDLDWSASDYRYFLDPEKSGLWFSRYSDSSDYHFFLGSNGGLSYQEIELTTYFKLAPSNGPSLFWLEPEYREEMDSTYAIMKRFETDFTEGWEPLLVHVTPGRQHFNGSYEAMTSDGDGGIIFCISYDEFYQQSPDFAVLGRVTADGYLGVSPFNVLNQQPLAAMPSVDAITLIPNPFNNSTRIKLNSLSQLKELRITNMLGQLIYTVPLTGRASELIWSAHNQQDLPSASGTYFIQVITGDGSYTKKRFC